MHLEIKQLVDKNFKNRNQFAKEMKLSYISACNLYEGKVSRIYFDTLQDLCNVLQCTPNDILIPDDIEQSGITKGTD